MELKSGEALRGLTFYQIHIIGDATRRVGRGKMNLPIVICRVKGNEFLEMMSVE